MTKEEFENEKCELLGIIQGKDKAIADLKKENARMRDMLKTLVQVLRLLRAARLVSFFKQSRKMTIFK